LTNSSGQFVDSHIIPLALTRLSGTGEKRIEVGIGFDVKRRANSWYDGTLVTRHGEEILARIDWKAIEELRAHRLVWSGWGSETELQTNDLVLHDGRPSYRIINLTEPKALQLFFLSLLWRAAASTRHEFSEISVDDLILEDIRKRLVNEDPGLVADYPVQLFQIITRGTLHNRTPLLERKPIINVDGSDGSTVSYVRFYFDGLVAHVHLPDGYHLSKDYLNTCLRYDAETIAFVRDFQSSRTAADIAEMVASVQRERMTIGTPLQPVATAVRGALAPKPNK
jgi:hypothetical protein